MAYKQYIGIIRDHSASMRGITSAAAKDYNQQILAIQEAAKETNIDTIVSTVKCGVGYGGVVERDVVNSNVMVLEPINERYGYIADGRATPLLDSVHEIVKIMKSVPDYDNPEISFLVMVITDGGENSSKMTWSEFNQMIKDLNNTDRWTFTFRVPPGVRQGLQRSGIPAHNILEWDGSSAQSLETASAITKSAVTSYYTSRSSGISSTKTFYAADLTNVKSEEIKSVTTDISSEVVMYTVSPSHNDAQISKFAEDMGKPYVKGQWFYQLTKTEKEVQDYKLIMLFDKNSGAVYVGKAAREILGIPKTGKVRLVPGSTGQYEIYIQSSSLNRKLKQGTKVIHWPKLRAV